MSDCVAELHVSLLSNNMNTNDEFRLQKCRVLRVWMVILVIVRFVCLTFTITHGCLLFFSLLFVDFVRMFKSSKGTRRFGKYVMRHSLYASIKPDFALQNPRCINIGMTIPYISAQVWPNIRSEPIQSNPLNKMYYPNVNYRSNEWNDTYLFCKTRVRLNCWYLNEFAVSTFVRFSNYWYVQKCNN